VLRYRKVERFVAWRGRTATGRVAAIVDPAFQNRWDATGGFFGFFETDADSEIAHALLEHAESWLRHAHGVGTVYGPINLSTHDEAGIVIEGGDRPPVILSPHTLPHYRTVIEDHGYESYLDLLAYGWTPNAPVRDTVTQLRRRLERRGITIRSSTPERWGVDSLLLRDLYNATFADLWGFVPLRDDEFHQRAREFKPFYRPELAVFAAVGDESIGFGLALPDINTVLRRVGGRLLPIGWWHLARGIPRIRSGRLILLGVLPPYRRTGVAAVLADALGEAGRTLGYEGGELSVVHEGNRDVQSVVWAFGGSAPIRRYRVYRKALEL
jgi:GNAT superfamily N-acetyltransferase